MNKREIDRELSLVKNGDNAAFERLYLATRRGVYSFLFTYFDSREDTEDALQTVFLKIKKNISKYNAGTNGLAWILQIAKNTALTEIEKSKSKQTAVLDDNLKTDDFSERKDERNDVLAAMKRSLTEEEQRIISLYAVFGYKHREIAKMLGVPTGTVTSKYKRAIDKLKNELKEDGI